MRNVLDRLGFLSLEGISSDGLPRRLEWVAFFLESTKAEMPAPTTIDPLAVEFQLVLDCVCRGSDKVFKSLRDVAAMA